MRIHISTEEEAIFTAQNPKVLVPILRVRFQTQLAVVNITLKSRHISFDTNAIHFPLRHPTVTMEDLLLKLAQRVIGQKKKGHSEKVYQTALWAELNHMGIPANMEVPYTIHYVLEDPHKEIVVGHHCIDIDVPPCDVVDHGGCFIEVKAIQRITSRERQQAQKYANDHKRLTFLINFCQSRSEEDQPPRVELQVYPPSEKGFQSATS